MELKSYNKSIVHPQYPAAMLHKTLPQQCNLLCDLEKSGHKTLTMDVFYILCFRTVAAEAYPQNQPQDYVTEPSQVTLVT
jgi:hypothetical protein